MKLLTQTGLYMVTLSLLLFFASGIGFYFVFRKLTNNSLDKDLKNDMEIVVNSPGPFFRSMNEGINLFDKVDVTENNGEPATGIIFADSILLANGESNPIPLRYVRFPLEYENKQYLVKIFKSKISSDALTVRITGLFTLLSLFFTIGILLLNRFGFRSTWKGFWNSLQKVQSFKAGDNPPVFETTEIDEFNSLNDELRKMTERITRDYDKLESFTRYSTHEYQTPLAVIRGKLDLLLQSENLSKDQIVEIQEINSYTGQLSRLNQSLSLLFKIENQLFSESGDIDLSELIEDQKQFLIEQAEIRGLKLTMNINPDVKIRINPTLAEVLVLNLLRNALFHNVEKGFIEVLLNKDFLIVKNSGKELDLDKSLLFDEFTRGKKSRGTGLGLAISRKICNQYGMNLIYKGKDQIHSFIVQFDSSSSFK